ncbi:MAG: hypothetical protein Q8L66_06220 [Caulobacter sp.]|nr:hypothetical protein [Caulobacter sp.]
MTNETDPVPPVIPPPENDDRTRLAVRLGTEYALKSLRLLSSVLGGDMIAAIVIAEIVSANTAHLNARQDARYVRLDDLPPDSERRPVSALAVAGSLGIPRETARRCIKRLEAMGVCQRVKGGVIIPTAVLSIPQHQPLQAANIANLRQLVSRVQALGVMES